jgi:hypothetical protein
LSLRVQYTAPCGNFAESCTGACRTSTYTLVMLKKYLGVFPHGAVVYILYIHAPLPAPCGKSPKYFFSTICSTGACTVISNFLAIYRMVQVYPADTHTASLLLYSTSVRGQSSSTVVESRQEDTATSGAIPRGFSAGSMQLGSARSRRLNKFA